ncbi:ExeA family protein [Marinobacterium marinum]|uniref:AAA family ATPase n=1 Tax=Marinobacterium marinum TaxID=2756129 RepID=A0A7W1WWK9_9GAMM|nr:ExeA family protein [Marinobacterium marinum]MBA4501544.1 AAA family ATPase [Marinobacterium marinum]
MSEQHEDALSHLLYGIEADGGFILLTGEVGTGKTTLSRRLIEQLPDTTDFALILNPHLQPLELLQSVCDELGLNPPGTTEPSMKALCDRIYRYLLQQYGAGRSTLLIIDEAQQLPFESLEQLRLLTNLETSDAKLLKVVLIGQPELLARLAQDDLRQLSQRISARFHLGPLSESDLPHYIHHRLQVAGLRRPVFPPATLKYLYRLSGGLPRVVNQICDRALLGTYVQTRNEVSVHTLEKAAREVLGQVDTPNQTLQRSRSLYVWLLPALLVGLLGWGAGLAASMLFAGQWEWPSWLPGQARPEPVSVLTDAERRALRAQLFPWEKLAPVNEVAAAVADPVPVLSSVSPSVSPASEPPPTDRGPEVAPDREEVVNRWERLDAWPAPADLDLAQVQAFVGLFQYWQREYDPRLEPVVCDFAERQGLGCLTLEGDLTLLDRLDRPAVITLRPGGTPYAALLTALTPDSAEITVNAEQRRLSRAVLQQLWGGQFTLLWQPPPGYRQPLWPGAQGEGVAWLAEQLNRQRGGRINAPAKTRYDAEVFLKVKAFQQQQGLTTDGIAGPLTLIRLNNQVRTDLPRLSG